MDRLPNFLSFRAPLAPPRTPLLTVYVSDIMLLITETRPFKNVDRENANKGLFTWRWGTPGR